MSALLEVSGLTCSYGSASVLREVDFVVERGAVTCVLGRNGVGKTTLLKALMGLLPGTRGRFVFDGKDISRLPTHLRARAGFAHVPQGRDILPHLSVEENIRLGGFAGASPGAAIPDEIWQYCPELRAMRTRPGGQLSGGQQQQLAIARAMMGGPQLLILDEPTEGIQPNLVQSIRATIRALNCDLGMTVLLVEQKIAFAREIGHYYYVLDRGSVSAEGAMDTLDDSVIRRYLEVA